MSPREDDMRSALLERTLLAQQDAVVDLDAIAAAHITAFYVPSQHEQRSRTSSMSGGVLPQRVVLLVENGGLSFSVKHGSDVLGVNQLSLDDVAKMNGDTPSAARLTIHGVGHYPTALRAVQHLHLINPNLAPVDLLRVVQDAPSVVNQPKDVLMARIERLSSLTGEGAPDDTLRARMKNH